MKQSKITKSGNIQLMLTPAESDYLIALIGSHVIGYGKNRDLNTDIWDKLDMIGIKSSGRVSTVDGHTMIELK